MGETKQIAATTQRMNILEQTIVSLGSLTEEQRRELMRRLAELGKPLSKPPKKAPPRTK